MKNKDAKTIYITSTIIMNDSIDDLDIAFKEAFKEADEDELVVIIKFIKEGKYPYANSQPVLIDDFIAKLYEAKNRGANYVQIEENCDHHGYDISAFSIIPSTKEEIKEFEDEIEKNTKKQLEDEITRLKEKMDKLKSQL